MLKGNFHAHIASRHHNTVARLADLCDIINARLIFDLRDKLNAARAYLVKIITHVNKILLCGNERASNIVNAVVNAKLNIALILLGKILLLHNLSGEAHTLSVGKYAAANNAALNVSTLDLFNLKGEQSVVKEYGVTHVQLRRKICIAYRNTLGVSYGVLCRKGKAISVRELDTAVLKGLDTVLRPLGIKHDSNRKSKLVTNLFNNIHSLLMILVSAVRKIQSRNVHTRLAKTGNNLLSFTCRA